MSMKPLPPSLNYAYLSIDKRRPVIVSSKLDNFSLKKLLVFLRQSQSVIGYSLYVIKGVSPTLVMHRRRVSP